VVLSLLSTWYPWVKGAEKAGLEGPGFENPERGTIYESSRLENTEERLELDLRYSFKRWRNVK